MITTVKNKTDLHRSLQVVASQIGNTPLLPILKLHNNPKVRIYAKAEWKQLSGSVKARAAFNIVKQALSTQKLTPQQTLLDATSGNTGIAYATIGKKLGIRVALCLPENASRERKEILRQLGAEIILTSKFGGTDEAQEKAFQLSQKYPEKYFYASQYTNDNNWKAHYHGTAEEIISAQPKTTHFVAGLGTTGTFVGTSRRLKEWNPKLQSIALQPDFALHGLEGWKHLETAHIPKIYDSTIADQVLAIKTDEAYQMIKKIRQTTGLLISPSAGANLVGALQVAQKIESGAIVTVLPDNGDKYSSIINQIR